MREFSDKAAACETQHRRLLPPFGTIAVGSAHFDPWLEGAVYGEYLRCLNRGLDPQACHVETMKFAQEATRKHNEKSSDINWKRCDEFGETHAIYIHRIMSQVERMSAGKLRVNPVCSWGRKPYYSAKVGTGPGTLILIRRAREFRLGQVIEFCDKDETRGMSIGVTPRWHRGKVWKIEHGRIFVEFL